MTAKLPARLRAARAYAGLTQPQLASRIELGQVTYALSEKGQRTAPRRELLAIAEACEVPMWFLEDGWEGWRGSLDDMAQDAFRSVPPRTAQPDRQAQGQ
ncbi:MAG TPA: helix-turn-helix domain-containing protein [Solirubrobacterales bacterium]|nr:helix-turn-helix domain-containing protein [Solirubrobacterales bacterium]